MPSAPASPIAAGPRPRTVRHALPSRGRSTAARVRIAFALALVLAAEACLTAGAAAGASGTLVAANCAPVAAAADGTMVWYARTAAGVWDAYIGDGSCHGTPLLPAYGGNRGPADITADGRYVLLTTAVGWDRALPWSSPGRGSQNAIQLYDRATGRLSTLLAGATSSQRGVIWPRFNSTGTKIVWSQMIKTGSEAPPSGRWALHVADVNLAAGTLANNVQWQDPNGEPAFYEAYGWIPNTQLLVFMSTTRASIGGFGKAQLFTLPDELRATTAPTRISPQFAPVWPWQSAVDAYHEFAAFAPGAPTTLYTTIAADTVGGDDLFSYDLRSQGTNGLLAQPTRISYFGGDPNLSLGKTIPGWPKPSYTVVTTMAWVAGGWVATTCPGMLCEQVSAWRIASGSSASVAPQPGPAPGSSASIAPQPGPAPGAPAAGPPPRSHPPHPGAAHKQRAPAGRHAKRPVRHRSVCRSRVTRSSSRARMHASGAGTVRGNARPARDRARACSHRQPALPGRGSSARRRTG